MMRLFGQQIFLSCSNMALDLERLRELRLARGLTHDEVAAAAGLSSRQAYQRIENGTKANVTISTLDAIAGALGVAPAELLLTASRTPPKRKRAASRSKNK